MQRKKFNETFRTQTRRKHGQNGHTNLLWLSK